MDQYLFGLVELFDRLSCSGQPFEDSLKIALFILLLQLWKDSKGQNSKRSSGQRSGSKESFHFGKQGHYKKNCREFLSSSNKPKILVKANRVLQKQSRLWKRSQQIVCFMAGSSRQKGS